jgi:RNA polymerase sigma-70 factor, ECF subfamily
MMTAPTPSSLLAEVWRDHRGLLHKVARSFARSDADEADLLQEMLLQLWQSFPRFAGQSKLTTWVYRVCLNTALAWKRDEQRRQRRTVPEAEIVDLLCPRPQPHQSHETSERLTALYGAIRRLPEVDRSLVLLLLDGLSYREIGEIAGITENHVGVALTRARKKLSDLLKDNLHEHR